MNKVVKVLSIIVLVVLMIITLGFNVRAVELTTPPDGQIHQIQPEGETANNSSNNNDTSGVVTPQGEQEVPKPTNTEKPAAEDKTIEVAKDKEYPNAGIEVSTMVYIIATLFIVAIIAYFKVVKYNLD